MQIKYPAKIFFAAITDDCKNCCFVDFRFEESIKWGVPFYSFSNIRDGRYELSIIWKSETNQKWYFLEKLLLLDDCSDSSILRFALFPNGIISLWKDELNYSSLVLYSLGEDITNSFTDYREQYDEFFRSWEKEYCAFESTEITLSHDKYVFSGCEHWGKMLKQYLYRIVITGDTGCKLIFDSDAKVYLVEYLGVDCTYNKCHDSSLLNYKLRGCLERISIVYNVGRTEFRIYFWFEEEKICSIFERFYGAHPDTKTDFIIRIDAEQKKYELALYRQGLKEPQIIPEDAYQLLVFKNKFEDYRSDNYNQERGAWIW